MKVCSRTKLPLSSQDEIHTLSMFSLHPLTGLQDAHSCFLTSSIHFLTKRTPQCGLALVPGLQRPEHSTVVPLSMWLPRLKLALPPVLTAPTKPAAGLELHYGEAQLAGSRDSLWSIASTHQQSYGLGSSVFLVSLKVTEAPPIGWTTTWELWSAGPRSPQQSCELIRGFARSIGGTFAGQQWLSCRILTVPGGCISPLLQKRT